MGPPRKIHGSGAAVIDTLIVDSRSEPEPAATVAGLTTGSRRRRRSSIIRVPSGVS